MKKFYLFILLIAFFASNLSAQIPLVLYKGIINSTPNAVNDRFILTSFGAFSQTRFLANVTGSSAWAFHIGTTAGISSDYNSNWRPNMPGQTMSIDNFIPTSYNNGAKYNTGGAGIDGGYNVTMGKYYTWNVSNSVAQNAVMQVLQTNFNPTGITTVTQSPATPSKCTPVIISITTASNPSAGENIFVRYTKNNYSSSTIVQASFVGSVGTAIIPASTANVSYYVYSSNKSLANINSDVVNNGNDERVHDMSTLNLNNNGGGNYSYTIGSSTGTWNGATNTDWSIATNWCDSIVPTAGTNANIPAGLTNYPVINNTTAVCNNISIASGASLTISSAGALSTAGNFDNLGTFTNNGLIKLSGSSAQTFPGTGTLTAINNIEIDNSSGGVSLNKAISITGALVPTRGTFALDNYDITLVSNPTATAMVGTLGAAAGFTYANGRFVVERFLRARSTWRLLATPVEIASSPSISSSWREGEAVGTNTATGFGTRITGPTGMDEVTLRYSMKSYNGSTNNYDEINTPAKLNGPIANDAGYYVFVRGDRGVAVGGLGITNLRIKGKLRTGNQTFTIPPISGSSTGFLSFGNPYPSAIDFRTIFNASIAQSYTVWNPDSAGVYGVGKFETYIYNLGSGHFQKTPNNEIRDSIQSGEAVFIQSLTGGSITVKESDKVGGSTLVSRNSPNAGRTNVVLPTLEINLFSINNDGSGLLTDGVLMNFDNAYSNSIDNMDIRKISNSADNIAIQKANMKLIAERRNTLTVSDTIFLSLTNTRVAPYRFQIDPSVLGDLPLNAFLKDKFTGTETPLSLADVTDINFTITNEPASKAADRFMITFRPSIAPGQLPGQFVSIVAEKNADKTNTVKWSYANELNIAQYSIERSVNETNYTGIGNYNAANNANVNTYSFNDLSATVGTMYYRVKATSTTGQVQYSNVVKVENREQVPIFTIQPNPVIDKTLHINFENMKGSYSMKLISKQGAAVFSKQINVSSINEVQHILIAGVAAGVYDVLLVNAKGDQTVLTIIVK